MSRELLPGENVAAGSKLALMRAKHTTITASSGGITGSIGGGDGSDLDLGSGGDISEDRRGVALIVES